MIESEVMGMGYESIIQDHGKKLENHEGRIHNLELSDVEQKVQIKNLVDSLKILTNWLRPLVIAMFGALLSFFMWYVQNMKG